jgi:hypothetical protein
MARMPSESNEREQPVSILSTNFFMKKASTHLDSHSGFIHFPEMTHGHFSGFLSALAITVLANSGHAQISGSDNFNDNSRDATKWTTDFVTGNGVFNETNQRLEYRVTSPNLMTGDEAERAWILNSARYTNDWEVILEVTNTVVPTIVNQLVSIGLEVFNAADLTDYVYVELYSSALTSLPFRRGFKMGLVVNDTDLNDATTGKGDVTNSLAYGAVRFTFNSLSKVFNAYVDRDEAVGGYKWEKLGSFGVAGSGGSITNGNWNMTPTSTFQVAIYGYSQGLTITSGQVHGDNFFAQTAPTTSPTITSDIITNSMRLRWPESAVAYEMQSRTNLAAGTWTTVTNAPVVVNGTNSLVLPLDAPMKFFRLKR